MQKKFSSFSKSTNFTKSKSLAFDSFESYDTANSRENYDRFRKFMPKLNNGELNCLNLVVANKELVRQAKAKQRLGYTPAFVHERGWGGNHSRSMESRIIN